MSALFAAIHTHSLGPWRADLNAAFEALSVYGPDGAHRIEDERYLMGFHAHNSLPEDGLSTQPIAMKNGRYLVFDGRIDNREVLIRELAMSDVPLSDAALMAQWIERRSMDALQAVLGPYAVVVVDPKQEQLYAARDPMGGRGLIATWLGSTLVLASDESAFCACAEFDAKLNAAKVARHIDFLMEPAPQSFFQSVEVVRPGELWCWQSGKVSKRRFYRPPQPDRTVETASLAANAARFRCLLDQAIARRQRGAQRLGVLLSGGLDSVPTILSAHAQRAQGSNALMAFSWVFSRTPTSDESHISGPLCKDLGIPQIEIDCDHIDVSMHDSLVMDRRIPFGLPYSEYQRATLEQARKQRCDVILSGLHGDLLYLGADNVVAQALIKGRFFYAWRELKALKQMRGGWWQSIKRYLLLQLPGVKAGLAWFRRHRPISSEQLSETAMATLKAAPHWLNAESQAYSRPEQYQKVLDGFAGEDCQHARLLEARYRVERRYPFRDRELCEFMLSVPSDHLFSLGVTRPIVKAAYASELPQAVKERNDKTLFVEPVVKQIKAQQAHLLSVLAASPAWTAYVRPDRFDALTPEDSLAMLALWRCAYYNLWRTRVNARFSSSCQ